MGRVAMTVILASCLTVALHAQTGLTDLQAPFPMVPGKPPEGAQDEHSTYRT
jgi:hypothetical protein